MKLLLPIILLIFFLASCGNNSNYNNSTNNASTNKISNNKPIKTLIIPKANKQPVQQRITTTSSAS